MAARRGTRLFTADLRSIAPVLLLLLLLVTGCRKPESTETRVDAPAVEPETPPPQALFRLPTPNLALLEPGAEERYFVGTVGRPWTSGTFGCVRSEGYQLHEGLDIRAVGRDAHGEANDPIMATADGTVAYLNPKAALSNYGIYLILRHQIQGWEVFSLYAHLARIEEDLRVGQPVQAGQTIGLMGRTSNTRQRISKERAHLHFELNFMISDHFDQWHRKHYPGQRNDHSIWNGRNFLGIDPRSLLLQPSLNPRNFSLGALIQAQPVLCRVLVRSTDFPWLRRYPAMIESGAITDPTQIVAHELHLNFLGMPLRIVPKTAAEAPNRAKNQILEVDPEVCRSYPCQKLIRQRNGRWEFTAAGERFLDLLTL